MDLNKGREQETDKYLDSEKKLIPSVQQRSGRLIRSCRVELLHLPSIPKQITTSSEKYVLRWLELIYDYAARGSSSWNLSKVHTSSALVECEGRRTDVTDMASSFLVKYPVSGGGDLIVTDWKTGGGTGGRSMRKILSSADFNASLLDISEAVDCASTAPRLRLLSGEPEKGTIGDDYKSVAAASMNLDKSTLSDSSIKRTLQCTWKDGVAHHVFSVEDKREVYTASASNVESDNDLDCIYTFYAGNRHSKDPDSAKIDSIATMLVFSSITFCSTMEQIRETKFILYASEEINTRHTSKSRLTRRMASLFQRPGQYLKQRSISRASSKSVVLEDTALSDHSEAEKNDLPSHENAAIVIRETCRDPMVADSGGWGLRFLRKSRDDQSSENTRNNGECSTSMTVIIPAGIHGGAKTGSAGPSTLVERWISGGSCDCGGWDMGCPLTVLAPKQSNSEHSKCNPVNLFIQDSRKDAPVFKMANIRDGSYDIHFQPRLSNLQSFAIAAAVIHSQNQNEKPGDLHVGTEPDTLRRESLNFRSPAAASS